DPAAASEADTRDSAAPGSSGDDDLDDDDDDDLDDDDDDDLDDDEEDEDDDDLDDEDDGELSATSHADVSSAEGADDDDDDDLDDDEDEDDVDEEGEDDLDDEDDDFDDDDDDADDDDAEGDDDEVTADAEAAADTPSDVPTAARIPVRRRTSPPRGEEEEEEDRGGRRRRRKRRGGNGGGKSEGARKRSESGRGRSSSGGRDGRQREGRSREGRRQGRVSRDVPITDVVKEGDHVIVQISKEPIGTKGARVTSHVSLPGRYCVFLPTVDHVGISKRIGSGGERARLRKVIDAMKPKNGGVIVRTVAAGLTKKALKADLGYLMRLWSDVSKKREQARAPKVLYSELDLVLKTARDLFTDEINKIVIDDKDQYAKLVRFVEMFSPERVKDVELYQGDEPIFDAYGIEDEITRALSRKVPLPSGGYLIIDQAEALSAIDVNTGRFVGKGSTSLEE